MFTSFQQYSCVHVANMGLRVVSVKDKIIVVRTGIVEGYSEYGALNEVLDAVKFELVHWNWKL